MAKTLIEQKARNLALEIQSFTADNEECNEMTVEEFIFWLLDYKETEE